MNEVKTSAPALTRADWAQGNVDEEGTKEAETMAACAQTAQPVYETLKEITPCVTGGTLMASKGLAFVKKVTLVNGKEVVNIIAIPITTERLDAVTKRFEDEREPIAPMQDKLILPSSKMGVALGLTKKEIVSVAQHDDPKYKRAIEMYNTKLTTTVVAESIDIPLYFIPSGKEARALATSTADKITALTQMGFAAVQRMQIAFAVQRIANWTETERVRFFGESLESK